jgi:hypothetical protein
LVNPKKKNRSYQKHLLTLANRRGYLNRSDIFEIFPDTHSQSKQYLRILSLLASQGIEVLNDEIDVDEVLNRIDTIDNARLRGDSIPNNDSVSLYLQEMSITPLLDLKRRQPQYQSAEQASELAA